MNILWKYQDYVKHLSHKKSVVRRWAFDAIESRYKNRYTDEVSKLVKDENEHLACAAARYLAYHNAVQHAPLILESFKKGSGNVSSNCAAALASMKYKPAIEEIIGAFSVRINSESSYGIFDYLGSVHNENSRDTLISAAMQIKDSFLQGCAFSNLLRHHHSEDMSLILKIILRTAEKRETVVTFQINAIMGFWDGKKYFNDLTKNSGGKNIIKHPAEVLKRFFKKHSQLDVKTDQCDMIVKNLKKGHYHDLVTTLMFEVQTIVQHRYPENSSFKDIDELLAQDKMAVVLLRELSKQPSIWRKLGKNKNSGIQLFTALVISVYFTVLERGIYLKALLPDATSSELISAVKKSGANLPEKICKKVVAFSPVADLKNALSANLDTWADIWIVKIMGLIGSREFVPDLIRVINICDSISYIYSSAIDSINALDESSDELLLTAIQNQSIGDWESCAILEHLPYAESFDLICRIWEDEKSEMDSSETFVHCLRGVGDKRGIKTLQKIYLQDNSDTYAGEVLECLSILHNINIPELPAIRKQREEEKKEDKIRAEELDEILNDMGKIGKIGNVIPFKRDMPKVGRNEPCPCGSGKKYKKCCLKKT